MWKLQRNRANRGREGSDTGFSVEDEAGHWCKDLQAHCSNKLKAKAPTLRAGQRLDPLALNIPEPGLTHPPQLLVSCHINKPVSSCVKISMSNNSRLLLGRSCKAFYKMHIKAKGGGKKKNI